MIDIVCVLDVSSMHAFLFVLQNQTHLLIYSIHNYFIGIFPQNKTDNLVTHRSYTLKILILKL